MRITLPLAWAVAILLAAGLRPAAAQASPAITDATGVAFSLASPVRRVISMAPSLTEEIFALGADGVLIADTTYCRYPAGALAKTKIGSTLSPNLELMVALHPDLVVATLEGNRMPVVQQLRRLGIHVFVIGESKNFADIETHFRTLARLLGQVQTGEAALRAAEFKIAAARTRVAGLPRVRTFFEVQQTPLVSASGSTFIDEILRDAGAVNVMATSPARYPHLSQEAVLRANPDAVLIDNEQSDPVEAARAWSRFPALAATRGQRIFLVSSHLFDTPTPMTFSAAVELAARRLHPEAF